MVGFKNADFNNYIIFIYKVLHRKKSLISDYLKTIDTKLIQIQLNTNFACKLRAN